MGTDLKRQRLIVETLVDAFSDLMKADATAFRVKFRKMAADAFAFYRGSGLPLLRRHDAGREDRWARRADRPGVDPRGPARRELRHVHERRRAAGLRRQRLRRGVRRASSRGTCSGSWPAWRCSGWQQGAARRRDHARWSSATARLPRPGARHSRGDRDARWALHAGHRRRAGADGCCSRRSCPPGSACSSSRPWSRTTERRFRRRARRRRLDDDERAHGRDGVRGLPRHDSRRPSGSPGAHLRRQGRRGQVGVRHRQRRAAVVQPAASKGTPRRWRTTSCST